MTPITDPKADSTESNYETFTDLYSLNDRIADKYHRYLTDELLLNPVHPVTQYLAARGISREQIDYWQLGFAPDQWQFVTDSVTKLDAFDLAVDLGVCRSKDGSKYDFFRNRLMIPIRDEKSHMLGFTARSIGQQTTPAGEKLPKYINTPETVIFRKEEILFGLNKARKEIERSKMAVLTEGQTDVMALHRAGITNAIGKQGSALTEKQIAKLVSLCESVTLVYDIDTNGTGQKAQARDTEVLLKAGLRVKIFYLPQPEQVEGEEPVKVDADSWVQSLLLSDEPADGPAWCIKLRGKLDLKAQLKKDSKDGLMELAAVLLDQEDMDDVIIGQRQIITMLSRLDDSVADAYVTRIAKELAWKKSVISKLLATAKKKVDKKAGKDDDDEDDFPEWVDRKEFFQWQFAERCDAQQPHRTGYYFSGGKGISTNPLTNFIAKPLFLIKQQGAVRRLVQLDNGYRKVYAEFDAKVLTGVTQFEQELSNLGYFTIDEDFDKKHLKRIMNKILAKTPEVYPVNTLGWQPEGFFAFSNAVFNGHLENYDEHGVVVVNEKHFFSPAMSPISANYRQEEDGYKHDRYLTFRPSTITFAQWGKQMRKVYGDRAMIGVTFVIATLFKDIVKKLAKIPLIYCYGPKDSGKSTYAESLLYVFFSGKDSNGDLMKPMNLGAEPTLAAFWTALARFRNCPFVFNEFDSTRVAPFVATAFKAAWDNEGRSRQSRDNKYQTEEQSVNCAPIIVGQYLATGDDGAVLSRSLIFEFKSRKDTPFTPEEKNDYGQLRQWEQAGLNGLLSELLPLRETLESRFGDCMRAVRSELAERLERQGIPFENRPLENIICLLSIYETVSKSVTFPMTRTEFWDYCCELLRDMGSQIHDSDVLTGFWGMLEYLLDRGDIVDGWDFKIETSTTAKLTGENRKPETISFDKPTRVLYLRMKMVHKPYAEAMRRQSNDKPQSEQTLSTYVRQQKYYLGTNEKTYFSQSGGEWTNTSAIVLNYDLLSDRTGMSLERFRQSDEDTRQEVTIEGTLNRDIKVLNVGAGQQIEFILQVTQTVNEGSLPRTEQFNVKCFAAPEIVPEEKLQTGTVWKVTGLMQEKSWKKGTETFHHRTLDVLSASQVDMSVRYATGYKPGEKDMPF